MKTRVAWMILLVLGLFLGVSDYTTRSVPKKYLKVPVEGVIYLVEHRLGMSLETLGGLLLRLAQADKEGRFDVVYQELLSQRLNNLVEVFADFTLKLLGLSMAEIQEGWPAVERKFRELPEELFGEENRRIWKEALERAKRELERIPVFIRALSVEYERVLKRFSPQELPKKATERLLNLLWNAIESFVREHDKPKFTRYFIVQDNFYIPKDDFVHLTIHWVKFIRPWLDGVLVDFGFPKVKGLETQAHWRLHFSEWGMRLGAGFWFGEPETIEKALAIISIAYEFAKEAKIRVTLELLYHQLPETMVFVEYTTFDYEWVCLHHQMLKTIAFVDLAAFYEWIYGAISVISSTETWLGLFRKERRRDEEVADMTAVNFINAPNDAEGFEKIHIWVESSVNAFEKRDERRFIPGFDIAAVVFTDPVDSEQAKQIRNLVDWLSKNIPRLSEHSYHWVNDPNDIVARAVVVAWKEKGENGKVTNWVSIIELGPGHISDKEKDRIAKAFASKNYHEYKPNNSSANFSTRLRLR